MANLTVAILQHNAVYKFFETLMDAAGITRCWIDSIDYQSEQTYILLTPAAYPIPPKDRKARIIVWDLEPHYHDFDPCHFDEVWTYSKRHAREHGYKFVPVTTHHNFPDIGVSDGSTWDVVHMSSNLPRRESIYSQLLEAGLRMPGGLWGENRHRVLSGARMVLNVFAYEHMKYISPFRPNWAAMYRVPLVCEAGGDTMGLRGKIIEVAYDKLVDYCKEVSDRELDDYRYALYEYACYERSIDKVIMANV